MNPTIAEHVLILQEYMETQKELIKLIEEQPRDEFEMNSYTVKVMEVEKQFNRLSEELAESIRNISRVE